MKKPVDPVVSPDTVALLYQCYGGPGRFYFRWKEAGCWNQSVVFFDSKELAVDSIRRIGFRKYLDGNTEIEVSPLTTSTEAVVQ